MLEKSQFLIELQITGQSMGEQGVEFIATGLHNTKTLKKLHLPRNGISSIESITTLCIALQASQTVETLDLSENNIEDQGAEAIKELIKSSRSLKSVKIDHNSISTTCFAVSLCDNCYLTHFSISHNPIIFENFLSILEMLSVNHTLKHLGLKGIKLSGPANIKENQSGVLSKQEAVILKLANVLRNSCLQSIAVDLDPAAVIQLRELEMSLLKHNNCLVSIYSDTINWSSPQHGHLLGIQKALKANAWMLKQDNFSDNEVPSDLESVIAVKNFPSKPSNKLNELDTDIEFYNPNCSLNYNSHFFNSIRTFPQVSVHAPEAFDGIKFYDQEISKEFLSENTQTSSKIKSKLDFNTVIEDFKDNMKRFEDEIIEKLNLLDFKIEKAEGKVKNIKSKGFHILLNKIHVLEKKNEANEHLLISANREISELKSNNFLEFQKVLENIKNEFNDKLKYLESKLSKYKKIVKDTQTSKVPEHDANYMNSKKNNLFSERSNYIEDNFYSRNHRKNSLSSQYSNQTDYYPDFEYNSETKVEKETRDQLDESLDYLQSNNPCLNGSHESVDTMKSKKIKPKNTHQIPGTAEKLVMEAINEKNYWTIRKKLEFTKHQSPVETLLHFYTPEDCPSKDLHQKLFNKGLNFIPQSSSASKNKHLL